MINKSMISIAFVDLRRPIRPSEAIFRRNHGGLSLWSFLFVVNVSVPSEGLFLLLYSLQVVFVHGVSREVARDLLVVLNCELGGLFFPACCFLAAWVPWEIWLSPILHPAKKLEFRTVFRVCPKSFLQMLHASLPANIQPCASEADSQRCLSVS